LQNICEKGIFDESISFDYIVDNKCFKHFVFNNKNIAHMIQSIRAWRDIAFEIKEACETIFVYDKDALSAPEFDTAIMMLKQSAGVVYNFSEAMELIAKLNGKQLDKASAMQIRRDDD